MLFLSSTLLKLCLGKACFLCEHDTSTTTRNIDIDVHPELHCPKCVPPVLLDSLPAQRVLEHMGAHVLHDSSVDVSYQPCGLCLRPSPICAIYLRKGKGATASNQVDWDKSTCIRPTWFSYSVAEMSSQTSPCSNVLLCALFVVQKSRLYGHITLPPTSNNTTDSPYQIVGQLIIKGPHLKKRE